MNIVDQCKAANALGGKTARACDSCLLKRARWFCSADDAFLCQSCDVSVHSANQLASRHERARTPRQGKPTARLQPPANHPLPLVPEINAEDGAFSEENEEQFLYRVPVFDPFADEFCTETVKGEESDDGHDLNLAELLSTCDDDLAEFAADVESLLGTGAEEDSGCPIHCKDEDNNELLHGKGVKIEDEEDDDDEEVQAVIACHFDPALDMELNWDFDYASSMARQETKNVAAIETTSSMDSGSESHVTKRMLLRLNYEAVIAAWAAQGSPWTNGVRPHFNLDEFMVTCLEGDSHPSCGGRSGANDAEREARVLRYKEREGQGCSQRRSDMRSGN
ncbi:UNVERIFIED_CONTAM: Zinc finger protein CONSTANS-LIKE 6 [Sesamum angustifolium]|uniref:Zinc finger protein CONSTANS-LIKE 6 n=1 Tax=Sesamum angustifolium TaxID=2727405 RepID=A0AAW2LIG8_9LAMI